MGCQLTMTSLSRFQLIALKHIFKEFVPLFKIKTLKILFYRVFLHLHVNLEES